MVGYGSVRSIFCVDCKGWSFRIINFLLPQENNVESEAESDEENPDQEEPPEPRTKADIYRLFNSKGPTNMIAGFMSDYDLKDVANILVIVSGPLENAYYKTLEQLSGGWNEQCAWASERSVGAWVRTAALILQTLESEKLGNKLGLTKPLRLSAAVALLEYPRWLSKELKVLEKAANFAFSLAENYMWSNLHYWMAVPELLAGLFHSSREVRRRVLRQARDVVESLLDAEERAKDASDSLLVSILQDVGWHRQQLPRQAMALLIQSNFADGTPEVMKLCKRLFTGSPSTKDVLENAFGFLHRMSYLNSTNQKFSNATKYAYNLLSPYAESGGCPQILPTERDFGTLNSPAAASARAWAVKHLYSPTNTMFPKPREDPVVPRVNAIYASKFRTAGPLSQQRSAAAMAFLCHDRQNAWTNSDLCWLGTFF